MAEKKKHTGKIIALCIVLLVLVGCVFVAIWQGNNIKALVYMQKYDAQERQALKVRNEEAVRRIIEKVPGAEVTPLSEEQEKKLHSGEISEEEALNIIMGEPAEAPQVTEETQPEQVKTDKTVVQTVPEHSVATAKPTATASASAENNESPTENKENDNGQLKKLFARVYLLRSGFTGRLNGLIAEAKAEVSTPEGKNNTLGIAKKYYDKAVALEKECDGQMNSLLSQIKDELVRTGGDTGIVGEIRSTYENEKSIMKATLKDRYL